MKIAAQGLAIVVTVFLIWFGLSQLDYVSFFKVKQNGQDLETALGELIWDEIAKTEDVVLNDSLVTTLDKLINPLCEANGIERDSLKVHIIEKDEINAFALPNNHLVVYTGLIADCKNQQALQGVLG
ncbi:MAG: M48 family metalloprotease, partial [Flavobacterium sp.]